MFDIEQQEFCDWEDQKRYNPRIVGWFNQKRYITVQIMRKVVCYLLVALNAA